MLRIDVPIELERWDEEKQAFVEPKYVVLQLEHSLVSIAKWESKWNKPFLTEFGNGPPEETIDYIKCMTITQNVRPEVYLCLTQKNIQDIRDYIAAPMTATTIAETDKGKRSSETVTSELIYYWMIALQIPSEYQKWHLNRLITLIKVCNAKNEPPKKMSRAETMRRNAALNAARRKKHNTRG